MNNSWLVSDSGFLSFLSLHSPLLPLHSLLPHLVNLSKFYVVVTD